MPNTDTDPKLPDMDSNFPQNTVPNESAGFAVEGFVRIFDPHTEQIFVETRA